MKRLHHRLLMLLCRLLGHRWREFPGSACAYESGELRSIYVCARCRWPLIAPTATPPPRRAPGAPPWGWKPHL